MKTKHVAVLLIVGWAVLGLTGCAHQTKIIEQRHWDLNQSIRKTGTEQLLLNIVRLRYDEMPFFLQISSISTQFSTQASIGASGTFTEKVSNRSRQFSLSPTGPAGTISGDVGGVDVPSVFGLDAGASYSESPVVTWSMPDSREYLGRLMAPMGADELTVLAQSGWDPERVFRAGVKKMNSLRSLEYRVGQGLYEPATYGEFMEALQLMVQLSEEDLVDLAYGVKSNMGGAKFPLKQLDTTAIADGLPYGLQFMTRDDPTVVEPLKLFKPLFLRFSKQSDSDPRAQRLRELLNLDPAKYSFGIVDTANSGVEQLRTESGRLTQVFDPDTPLAEIVMNNRSVMEVLYLASTYVQVPEADLAKGNANPNVVRPEAEWLDIRTSQSEPSNAWIKIKYRGSWFYVAANDVNSRASFTLLEAIFASVVGNVPGAKPLLTLPVK